MSEQRGYVDGLGRDISLFISAKSVGTSGTEGISKLNLGDKVLRRMFGGVLLGLLIASIVAIPVLAAYYAYITVTESLGNSYTQLALNYSLNVTYLVDEGYISPSGMDTRVTSEDYGVLPHMLAEDRLLWVSALEGSTETQFYFFTGQDALNSTPIITGHGGYVTVPDNADLEPGGIFAFVIVGYVDTSSAARGPIIHKDGAVDFDVTDVGELTFNVTGGNAIVASNITSGYMSLLVLSDGFTMWIEKDDVQVGSNVTASAIPDTSNNWTLFQNDVMPYVSYYAEWVAT